MGEDRGDVTPAEVAELTAQVLGVSEESVREMMREAGWLEGRGSAGEGA